MIQLEPRGGDEAAIQAQTLPGLVYERLHRMIVSGRIAPGEKLNEVELAKRLNVSRGPIREACRQLLQSGLLQAEAQKGFRVASYSVAEAEELTVIRAELAALIGRLAARNVTETGLGDLRKIIVGMRAAVDRRSLPDYFSLSFAFYERICDLGGNSKLKEIYMELCCRMRLFRLQAHAQEGRLSPETIRLLETGVSRRESVIEALATGDAKVAAKAMRDVAESALVRNRDFYLRTLKRKRQQPGHAA